MRIPPAQQQSCVGALRDDPTSLRHRIGTSLQERRRGVTTLDDVLQGMGDGSPVEAVTVFGHGGSTELLASRREAVGPRLVRRRTVQVSPTPTAADASSQVRLKNQ